MKKLIVAIAFLLVPAFVADAATAQHQKPKAPHAHVAPKARAPEPPQIPSPPPVTRLPVAPDTFRA